MKVFDFLTQTKKEYPLDYSILQQTQLTGHGGADYYLMDSFIQAVAVSNFIIIKDPLLFLLILNSTSLPSLKVCMIIAMVIIKCLLHSLN